MQLPCHEVTPRAVVATALIFFAVTGSSCLFYMIFYNNVVLSYWQLQNQKLQLEHAKEMEHVEYSCACKDGKCETRRETIAQEKVGMTFCHTGMREMTYRSRQ